MGSRRPVDLAARVQDMFADSECKRVICIVGPALSGKTHALHTLSRDPTRETFLFSPGDTHRTLFEFVHGLVTVLEPVARGATVSFSALHSRLSGSTSPEARICAWLSSHLGPATSVIAIDNIELLRADSAIARFVDQLVTSVPSLRWVLAGRDFRALPLDRWLDRTCRK